MPLAGMAIAAVKQTIAAPESVKPGTTALLDRRRHANSSAVSLTCTVRRLVTNVATVFGVTTRWQGVNPAVPYASHRQCVRCALCVLHRLLQTASWCPRAGTVYRRQPTWQRAPTNRRVHSVSTASAARRSRARVVATAIPQRCRRSSAPVRVRRDTTATLAA